MLRKRVRFDRAAEFLAACASGDTEEAELMLKDTEGYETDREEYVEIINCTNADGITALHQVRPFFLLKLKSLIVAPTEWWNSMMLEQLIKPTFVKIFWNGSTIVWVKEISWGEIALETTLVCLHPFTQARVFIFFPSCCPPGLHRRQYGDGVLPSGAWCQREPSWQWGMDAAACCCFLWIPWNCRVGCFMPPQFENTAWEVRNHFAANRSFFFSHYQSLKAWLDLPCTWKHGAPQFCSICCFWVILVSLWKGCHL